MQDSPVSGPRGLQVGDEVTRIDACRVTSITDWATCIRVILQEKNNGYCVPLDMVKQQDVSMLGK